MRKISENDYSQQESDKEVSSVQLFQFACPHCDYLKFWGHFDEVFLYLYKN